MSGALNKLFLQDPINFLKSTPMGCGGKLSDKDVVPVGHYDLDLSYPMNGEKGQWHDSTGLVLVRKPEDAKRPEKADDRKIDAYWLPWQPEATMRITLGEEATYFFTSTLDGCRIQIAGNTILHIAADLQKPDIAAKNALGPVDYVRSQSVEYGEYGFFGGFRTGKSWKFVIQKKDWDIKAKKWIIKDAKEVLGGTITV